MATWTQFTLAFEAFEYSFRAFDLIGLSGYATAFRCLRMKTDAVIKLSNA